MTNPAPGFVDHPNHVVAIEPFDGRITVNVMDQAVARSDRAFIVKESRHGDVAYLPIEDVDQASLTATDATSYCPFKGHASYWSVTVGDETLDNAMWSYQEPFDECEELRGLVAFYDAKFPGQISVTLG